MGILDKHPALAKRYKSFCKTRRDEILANMVDADNKYNNLQRVRTDASITLKEALDTAGVDALLFEAYSDAVYAQEVYELDTIYKQAFLDALILLEKLKLI